VFAIDSVKVLFDREDEENLPEVIDRMSKVRHMVSNSLLSFPAKVNSGANPWKSWFGGASYKLSVFKEAFWGGSKADVFEIEIDGKRIEGINQKVTLGQNDNLDTISTPLVCLSNISYLGAGMILNPFPISNDGLLDITWVSDPDTKGFNLVKVMQDSAKGGIQTSENT